MLEKRNRNTGTFQAVYDVEMRDVGVIFHSLTPEIKVSQNNA